MCVFVCYHSSRDYMQHSLTWESKETHSRKVIANKQVYTYLVAGYGVLSSQRQSPRKLPGGRLVLRSSAHFHPLVRLEFERRLLPTVPLPDSLQPSDSAATDGRLLLLERLFRAVFGYNGRRVWKKGWGALSERRSLSPVSSRDWRSFGFFPTFKSHSVVFNARALLERTHHRFLAVFPVFSWGGQAAFREVVGTGRVQNQPTAVRGTHHRWAVQEGGGRGRGRVVRALTEGVGEFVCRRSRSPARESRDWNGDLSVPSLGGWGTWTLLQTNLPTKQHT